MRTLHTGKITEAVKRLCIDANLSLPADVERAVKNAAAAEESGPGRWAMDGLCENLKSAKELSIPICQDTGMAVVFVELGQELRLTGPLLRDAVDEGVRQGYLEGRLRLSVVADPLRRVNTGDNAPAIVHTEITAGDRVKITVAPKGFGSENMSAVRMFTPAATREDIIGFIAETVENAGSNPCPPVVAGVGLGGDFEYCAVLAKRALLRPLDDTHPDEFYAGMERDALERINQSGLGPMGLGGRTAAFGVKILAYPTHIAGLPAAVNISCHATRHCSALL